MNEEHTQEVQENKSLQGEPLDTEQGGNSLNPEAEYKTDLEASKNSIIVAVLATVVVVVTLMYIWGSRVDQRMNEEFLIDTQTPLPPDEQTATLKQVDTSDELNAIETDLRNTETETLDADLSEMEAELEKELEVKN